MANETENMENEVPKSKRRKQSKKKGVVYYCMRDGKEIVEESRTRGAEGIKSPLGEEIVRNPDSKVS